MAKAVLVNVFQHSGLYGGQVDCSLTEKQHAGLFEPFVALIGCEKRPCGRMNKFRTKPVHSGIFLAHTDGFGHVLRRKKVLLITPSLAIDSPNFKILPSN